MEKTINGVKYYLPSNLTLEQKAIYVHIIDWKRKNITTERGMYKGHEYEPFSQTIKLFYNDIWTNHTCLGGNATE